MSIPALSTEDLEHAASIVQRIYYATSTPDDQQLAQRQLFELQQKVEAWNIILPFLQHDDANLQFIGAHTAQVKIARDWDTLPPDDIEPFKLSILDALGFAAANRRPKIVLRKLYVALISLALKLNASSPPQWRDWVVSSLNELSSRGLPQENLFDYAAIVAEEAQRSDYTGPAKIQLSAALRSAAPVIAQAASASLSNLDVPITERAAALKCIESWILQFPGDQLTEIVPTLLEALSQPDLFVGASDVIVELMTTSTFSSGAGTRTLTEPLLHWVETEGKEIFQSSVETETIDEIGRGLCKMLVAVGDHSLTWLMQNMLSQSVLSYLDVLLGFTGFPGWYGVDEFESDLVTNFWVYFTEAILDSDWMGSEDDERMRTAHDILVLVVKALRKKCCWPPLEDLRGWTKDQKDTFIAYRRDTGEALQSCYYVLRDETLHILLDDSITELEKFAATQTPAVWEEIEASIHCVASCQEAIPLAGNPVLERLFAALTRVPNAGRRRLRQTSIHLIGDYSTWFAEQPTPLLLSALSYVVAGISDQALCLTAAVALKQLCDANRTKLAPHIADFGDILSSSAQIPPAERAKVIESISSVIEALPPEEGVGPVVAILEPIVQAWRNSLGMASQYPEEARLAVEQQLRLVSACSKGLSPAQDPFSYEEPDSPEGSARVKAMERARADPRLVDLRGVMVELFRESMAYWSADPELSDAASDFVRFITSLPLEATFISLPTAPLLELVCLAASRQLTAVWLTLVSRLVVQLQPPSFITLRAEAESETKALINGAAQSVLLSSMEAFRIPGTMEGNPDLVQSFFSCMDSIAHTFIRSIMLIPSELSNGLMECATRSITLQERYSLVAGCKFLVTFIKRSASDDIANEPARALLAGHAQNVTDAVVNGIAGDAPRSVVPNLAAVLSALVSKFPAETRVWLQQAMQNPRLAMNPKATPEAKETFLRTINASRSSTRTVTAANEFALIARGLSGTSYAAGQTL